MAYRSDVREVVEAFFALGISPSDIYRQLPELARKSGNEVGEWPGLRTIQQWKQDMPDDAAKWTLTPNEQRVGAKLSVLKAVLEISKGRRTFISVAEANWSAVILEASEGEIEPFEAWTLAIQYIRNDRAGTDSAPLDIYLALQGWSATDLSSTYLKGLVDEKWSPVVTGGVNEQIAPFHELMDVFVND